MKPQQFLILPLTSCVKATGHTETTQPNIIVCHFRLLLQSCYRRIF